MNYITINASVATPSTEEMAYAQTNNRLDVLDRKLDTSVQQLRTHTNAQINALSTSLENTETSLTNLIDNQTNAVAVRIDNIIAHNADTDGNTELIDIRSGYNGRVYSSAGTAVRNQLYNTNTLLNKADNEIFTTALQTLELEYSLGYQHVDGTFFESQLYSHTDISVTAGEVYYITGWNFYNVLLYAILDINGNVLAQEQESGSANADEYTDFQVVIPPNAAILRVNRKETPQQSNFIPTVKKEVKTSKITSGLNTVNSRLQAVETANSQNAAMLDNTLYSRTSALVDMSALHTGMMIKTWVSSANKDDPSSYLGGNSSRIYTDVYPVHSGDIIKSAFQYSDQKNFTYMLFDANGDFSSTATGTSVTVANDGYIIFDFPNSLLIPEGIVIVENADDFPYPVPYKKSNFQANTAFETELPLQNIDKTGGYTAIFHDIGIIGDSLACGCMEGVDTTNNEYKYTDNLNYSWAACIERATGCNCHQFCRGGQYLHDNNWYSEWKQALAQTPCTAYIICIGFNDYNWLNQSSSNLGTLADIKQNFETNPNTFYGQYGKMISYIKSVQPKAKIFLVNMEWNSTDNSSINTAISEICTNTDNCYLIDLKTYAHEPYWNVPNIFKTGLYHKNTLGYQKTAWDIISYIDYIVRHNMDEFIDVQFIGTDLRLPTQADIS